MKTPIIRELCTDNLGNLSQNKLWAHVAKAAATAIFIRTGWNAQSVESVTWLLLAYVAVVGGSELAAKAMNLRWGGNGTAAKPPVEGQQP